MKSLKQFLNERAIDTPETLYHITTLHSTISILREGAFNFRKIEGFERETVDNAMGNQSAAQKYNGFISTARTPNNAYSERRIYIDSLVVLFSFDRDEIKKQFKIIPVNYFSHYRKDKGNFEYEDRILSKQYPASMDINSTVSGCYVFLKHKYEYFYNEKIKPNHNKDKFNPSPYAKEGNFYNTPYGRNFLEQAIKYEFPVWGFEAHQKK